MNNWLTLPKEEQIELFTQIGVKTNLPPQRGHGVDVRQPREALNKRNIVFSQYYTAITSFRSRPMR